MVKVINISEVNTVELFQAREFLLGNKAGDWFVVTDDDLYLGRYINKADAEQHAATLNSGPHDDRPIEEIMAEAKELLSKMEDGEYD